MPSLHGWTGSYPAYVLVGQNCPNMLDLHPIHTNFHREKHNLQTEVDFKGCHIFSYHTCSSLFSGQITINYQYPSWVPAICCRWCPIFSWATQTSGSSNRSSMDPHIERNRRRSAHQNSYPAPTRVWWLWCGSSEAKHAGKQRKHH